MKYTNEAIRKRQERKNKINQTIKIIVYILLIPMLVYNITLIIQSVINPEKTPSFLGIKMYVIISGSMEPELEIGDIVIVKNTEPEKLQEGDVISYRKGQVVVTHRITEIITTEEAKEFRTKGDNNNVEDAENIKEKDIEGKVIKKIPTIGKLVLMLKDKTMIITIVLFYYIYIIHDQTKQRRKETRRIKREEYEAGKNEK